MSIREFFNSRLGYIVSVLAFGACTYFGVLAGVPA